jgi:hypothetical protein
MPMAASAPKFPVPAQLPDLRVLARLCPVLALKLDPVAQVRTFPVPVRRRDPKALARPFPVLAPKLDPVAQVRTFPVPVRRRDPKALARPFPVLALKLDPAVRASTFPVPVLRPDPAVRAPASPTWAASPLDDPPRAVHATERATRSRSRHQAILSGSVTAYCVTSSGSGAGGIGATGR